jgi:hypothetical protein
VVERVAGVRALLLPLPHHDQHSSSTWEERLVGGITAAPELLPSHTGLATPPPTLAPRFFPALPPNTFPEEINTTAVPLDI